MKKTAIIFSLLLFSLYLFPQQTKKLYLTGKGLGDTQTWQFWCSEGHRSKEWSTIEVPSQWELQGYGDYCYGRWYTIKGATPPKEKGIYKRSFDIPDSWAKKQIKIVFEGSMTDTEVLINGKVAGPIHQGGFDQFSYDITDKITIGSTNTIEVKVSKESSNQSVNAAERKADWWIFGGIYRPVYLEAKPKANIDRIAVNAKMDGSFYADIYTSHLPKGFSIESNIFPVNKADQNEFRKYSHTLSTGKKHSIEMQWDNVKPWNVENPNLYRIQLDLINKDGEIVHTHSERIGFRTVEFRKRDGVYVNNVKVVLKGINRHSFHPDGGRTTNREISLTDVELIKAMNMNAVRFHYAPDKHFLEICDSLGLFVINELAGWQNAYDTEVGKKIQYNFISRDVNHPSIIIWSNGNEGGWNYELDSGFAELDPQKRHVIHAWADFNDLDTHHYPTYQTGVARFNNGYKLFMPTEFMHGTYDQGHGAGLEDFWNKWTSYPLFVGGFMWDFSDNAVVRTDKDGILDSDGSNGADGILGPYREKEGSYYSVREIWAPIKFKKQIITPSFNGQFLVENGYLYTNLRECRMEYRVYSATSPLSSNEMTIIASGRVNLPPINPSETGHAKMEIPSNFFEGDILELVAWDKDDKEICNWTWTIHYADEYTTRELTQVNQKGIAHIDTKEDKVILSANGVSVSFDCKTGYIHEIINSKSKVSFNNGPIPVGMKARVDTTYSYIKDNNAIFTVKYLGAIDSIQWEMTPSGIMQMHSVMLNRGKGGKGFDDALHEQNIINFGLSFSYPEEKVKGMRWLGRGPYRVWKNRIPGANFGIWEKEYNNTLTGASYETLIYPEFKGYHGNIYWSTLQTTESDFTVYSESDGIYMQVYTPEEPKDNKANKANPSFPKGDISFLLDIPAIRCFKPTSQQGPQSQPGDIRIKLGDEGLTINLWFDFRNQ